MALDPRSAKVGFLLDSNEIEYPIYFWNIPLISKNYDSYRTSRSQSYPRLKQGLTTETLTIQGVGTTSPFTSRFFSSDISVQVTIGWYNFAIGGRYVIFFDGTPVEERIDINYVSSNQPSHSWTTQLLGVLDYKQLLTDELQTSFVDKILCSAQKCARPILTSDTSLNLGQVKHVTRAAITYSRERDPLYATSRTANHLKHITGVKNTRVEFDIQGDFDYWINNLLGDTRHNYRFYHGTGGGDYWAANNMKQMDLSNLITNIQTGQIIQATVHLGASY